MQSQTQVAYRQPRLASINDSTSKQQQQQMQSPSTRLAAPAASTNTAVMSGASSSNSGPYIPEEFLSYLIGGPCNRFALALKSNLDNEIDWACVRLVAATHQAPESWSLKTHAPFLVEAVLSVLERSRKELAHSSNSNKHKHTSGSSVKQMLLTGSGREAMAKRARQRAGLLATVLFNMAQIGDNSVTMSQDLRVTIECTQWLRGFHGDVGFASVQAEFLDVLDILLPLAPAPAFDSAPVRKWPAFGARESSDLDALALVETCLWEQLVRVVCGSAERKLVVGAVRVLVQSVSWHPQLAREILDLPVPKWSTSGASPASASSAGFGSVGEMLNQRLAELILAPDAEIVGASFELLLNMVRLEAMSQALDEELEAFAHKSAAANGNGNTNGASKSLGVKRRRRARGGYDTGDSRSGGDSGAQTPVFGFRPLSRTTSANAVPSGGGGGSEPTMLPDGLAGLVALVLQQWASAASPPALASSQPLDNPTEALGKPGSGQDRTRPGPGGTSGNAAANRPPTEPELREACTWVLLNYELVPPPSNVPQQALPPPTYVAVADIFNRYIIAKHGQTAPRIGRALNLSEIVRVIAAVFPKASLQSMASPQQQQMNAKTGAPAPAESLAALYLKPKTQNIVPIPAVQVEPSAQVPPPPTAAAPAGPNSCLWLGCGVAFASESEALAHIATHISGADACRWRTCNRIPANQDIGAAERERWIARHVLAHGPFYKDPAEPGPEAKADLDLIPTDLFALAKSMRDQKSQLLLSVSPLFANGHVPPDHQAHEVVLRLVMQGIGLIDQLQTWADRREGLRGLQDKARVWRNADDVLERLVFVAAQPLPTTHFAMRLLSVIRNSE
ncbi:hypothetical protein GGH93_001188 [Coemansia aciculifera]|nr:hypothetical protein GGH93_001188 [Coemansia aciculifera]